MPLCYRISAVLTGGMLALGAIKPALPVPDADRDVGFFDRQALAATAIFARPSRPLAAHQITGWLHGVLPPTTAPGSFVMDQTGNAPAHQPPTSWKQRLQNGTSRWKDAKVLVSDEKFRAVFETIGKRFKTIHPDQRRRRRAMVTAFASLIDGLSLPLEQTPLCVRPVSREDEIAVWIDREKTCLATVNFRRDASAPLLSVTLEQYVDGKKELLGQVRLGSDRRMFTNVHLDLADEPWENAWHPHQDVSGAFTDERTQAAQHRAFLDFLQKLQHRLLAETPRESPFDPDRRILLVVNGHSEGDPYWRGLAGDLPQGVDFVFADLARGKEILERWSARVVGVIVDYRFSDKMMVGWANLLKHTFQNLPVFLALDTKRIDAVVHVGIDILLKHDGHGVVTHQIHKRVSATATPLRSA